MKIFKAVQYDPSQGSLEDFKKGQQAEIVLDMYDEMLEDLFLVRNPRFKFNPDYKAEFEQFKIEDAAGRQPEQRGAWFYFPWSKTLAHYLNEAEFLEVRTARNKNLVTLDEQQKYYNATIGISGLSIGSHAALTIAMMGGAKNIKLADPDTISASNLNRIRYGATKVGASKAYTAAEIVAEMNPYSNIYLYEEGINEADVDQFLNGGSDEPKLDVLVEEMDNLGMKILARIKAREYGIPVIMATDNGDGVIVDIERFDQQKDTAIFNGVIGDITLEEFTKFPPTELPKLATKLAGAKLVVPRMKTSLLQIGRTLYSWPQLGSAATFSGVVLAYLARKIILGDPIKGGKYDLNLDAIFEADYNEPAKAAEREQITNDFLKTIGLQ